VANNGLSVEGGIIMKMKRVAAIIYAIVSLGVIAFQIALAAGAPWGAYAMGGAFPGQFPPALRIAAVIQAVLLAGLAAVILARGLGDPARMVTSLSLARMGRGSIRDNKFHPQPAHAKCR
jgi:hypothetical protein